MKCKLIAAAFVSMTAALSLGTAAQSSTMPSSSTSTPSSTAQSSSRMSSSTSADMARTGSLEVHRVSDEIIAQQLTAKDLLGKAVYGVDGEKLGDISDISLASGFSAAVAESLRNAGTAMTTSPATGTGASANTTASDMRTATSLLSSIDNDDLTVFISVGGLLGIGDNLVSVPASALNYDAQNQHFTLNVRKADFVALAQERAPTYASTSGTSADRANMSSTDRSGSTMSPGTSAKQAWDDDADAIKEAFRNDAALGSLASRLNVEVKDEAVVLSGTVLNESDKARAASLARQHTSLRIRNEIEVSR